MTTRLNITLLCYLCLTAWGCNTSRHSTLDAQCYNVADSNNVSIQKHLISSLTSDSLNLQLIEITTPATDSIDALTVKIARLSRSIDHIVTTSDSTVSSTTESHNHTSLKTEICDIETQSPTRHLITLFSIVSLAAFLIYLILKK